jgi:ABC-type sugar transport system permease subunit
MIGFIRRSDLSVLLIGLFIAIPLSLGGMIALLTLFPRTSENVALVIWICLMVISYVAASKIWKWMEKRLR